MVNIFVFKYVFNFFSIWKGTYHTLDFQSEIVFDPIGFRASWLKLVSGDLENILFAWMASLKYVNELLYYEPKLLLAKLSLCV